MSLEKIQQALLQTFVTEFPIGVGGLWVGRIAWENMKFKPPTAMPWMAFFFLAGEERIATLGAGGSDEVNGLVQIDLNVPIGIGEHTSRETINQLRACFRPRVIGYDDQPVTILSRSRAGGMDSNGFYKIPFNVRWRAQVARNPFTIPSGAIVDDDGALLVDDDGTVIVE